MTTQLEQDLTHVSDRYEYQQREIREIIEDKELEIRDVCIKWFEALVDLALTDKQKHELGLKFHYDTEDHKCQATGMFLGKPYCFAAKHFRNDEVGWIIVFFDEDEDECQCALPFNRLYEELLKVLMRYRNMLRKSEQSSPDDEADSDADSTTEKEE